MTLAKKSQLFDLDGVNLPTDQFFADDLNLDKDMKFDAEPLPIVPPRPTPLFPTEKPDTLPNMPNHSRADELNDLAERAEEDENQLVVTEDGPMDRVMSVALPFIPGADISEDDEDEFADVTVEEEPDDIVIDDDPWKWTVSNFGEWLSKIMHLVPSHSGRETSGLERAISHLEAIDREISKAVRADRNGEIDITMIEKARDELYDGVVRLQERLDKIRDSKYSKRKGKGKKDKKASAESGLIKDAKASYTGDMVVTVPFIVSIVARTCLNSMISAGKDIEDTFEKLAKEFELTRREEEETMQLLRDMGYSVIRRPRGYARDVEIDYTLTDNNDWGANYPG